MKSIVLYLQKHYQRVYNLFLFAVATACILYILPEQGRFKYAYNQGEPWVHEDLAAPFDFPVFKSDEALKAEIQEWRDSHPVYLRRSETPFSEYLNQWERTVRGFNISKDTADYIIRRGKKLMEDVFEKGIIAVEDVPNTKSRIWYLEDRGAFRTVDPSGFYTPVEAAEYVRKEVEDLSDPKIRTVLQRYLPDHIAITFNIAAELTNRKTEEYIANISRTEGMVQEGEVIVHHNRVVNNATFQKLNSLRYMIEGSSNTGSRWKITGGHFILVVLVLTMLYFFLQQFRPQILQNSSSLTLILVTMVGMVVLADVVLGLNAGWLYITPFPIVPIILRSFYDTRLALFIHIMVVMVVGLIAPNGLEFVFLQVMAGVFSIITVTGLYRRSQLFVAAAKITVVYMIGYVGFLLIRGEQFQFDNLEQFGYFSLNGLMSLFAYPLIYIFEKIFGLVSDVTLLELGDTNSPVLKDLRISAPGTFQHSLQVANLAESVIDEIGGSTLLVRTGALYHDIGKIKNPMYFIENQNTGVNPHNNMEPLESARIIIRHVRDGVEIAKSKRIPDTVIDFIRTHHGDTRVEYFYHAWSKGRGRVSPEEELQFQYPGPKPFSKETAVVMMADTVEAATRTLVQPSAAELSEMVDKLIDHKLKTHQFDNANITLGEISRSREVLKKKLMSIHHLRVEYPD